MAESGVEVVNTAGDLQEEVTLDQTSHSHLIPGRVQLGGDELGQPLLAQALQAGQLAGEGGQAGGEVGLQGGEVGLQGAGQHRHTLHTWGFGVIEYMYEVKPVGKVELSEESIDRTRYRLRSTILP